jgi:Putative zinc-finger
MSDPMTCDAVAELAPELALGIVTGDQRARALAHLAGCGDCRARVEELSGVADALLLLAPAREPPAGFESRVLARLPAPARPRRWLRRRPPAADPSPGSRRPVPASPRGWRRLGLAAAALLLAAAVGGSGVFAAGSGDRAAAERYRRTLAAADGQAFGAWRLGDAGTVFIYQGSPSWMFVSMRPAAGGGPFACELVLTGGRRVPLGTFSVQAYQSGWGRTIPVGLDQVARVELRDLAGGRTLRAQVRRA